MGKCRARAPAGRAELALRVRDEYTERPCAPRSDHDELALGRPVRHARRRRDAASADGATGDALDAELAALEHRVGRLADLCTRLDLENRSLREQQRALVEERARLIEKNDTARSKVEQMIVRLRSLEAGQ